MCDNCSSGDKLKRADEHIGQLETKLSSLSDNYSTFSEISPQTQLSHYMRESKGGEIRVISTIIGDAVHNIRSAVDHAYVIAIKKYAEATYSPRTKMPIYRSRKEFEGGRHNIEVNKACPEFYKFVLNEIKPYLARDSGGVGNDLLVYLHDLDVIDKHEALISATQQIVIKDFALEDEAGETHTFDVMAGWGENNIRFAFNRNFKIKDHGKLTISVSVNQIDRLKSVPIAGLLKNLRDVARYVVIQLENFS